MKELKLFTIGPGEILGLEEIFLQFGQHTHTVTCQTPKGMVEFLSAEEVINRVFTDRVVRSMKRMMIKKEQTLKDKIMTMYNVKNDKSLDLGKSDMPKQFKTLSLVQSKKRSNIDTMMRLEKGREKREKHIPHPALVQEKPLKDKVNRSVSLQEKVIKTRFQHPWYMNSAKVERAYNTAIQQAMGKTEDYKENPGLTEKARFIDVAGPKLIPDDDDPNTEWQTLAHLKGKMMIKRIFAGMITNLIQQRKNSSKKKSMGRRRTLTMEDMP